MICVAVTYVIKSGHEEEAVALFAKLTTATRAEPGCRMYLADRSTTDPRRFFLYEQYDDSASLDAHRGATLRAVRQRGALSDPGKPFARTLRAVGDVTPLRWRRGFLFGEAAAAR